jgi:predicted Zn-dependent peptidase
MNRLGAAVLCGLPLLSIDEVVERIESVTLEDVNGLVRDLLAPERLSAAAIGADEDVFRSAIEPLAPGLVAEPVA